MVLACVARGTKRTKLVTGDEDVFAYDNAV